MVLLGLNLGRRITAGHAVNFRGDETGFLRREKNVDRSQLGGLAGSAQWNTFPERR